MQKDELQPVHPHSCGGYKLMEHIPLRRSGSSPLMWGLLGRVLPALYTRRFIPTHVGVTCGPWIHWGVQAVHPHSCGGYRNAYMYGSNLGGSSPLMWGLQSERPNAALRIRFIPTHVGVTSPSPPYIGCSTVHPHSCGGYLSISLSACSVAGSSPVMWGVRIRHAQELREIRFIPTHVGVTARLRGM